MKSIGPKPGKPSKLPSGKSIDPGKIMAQAKKLTASPGLNAFKKLYGNDRGSFLHKQSQGQTKSNTIGKPC